MRAFFVVGLLGVALGGCSSGNDGGAGSASGGTAGSTGGAGGTGGTASGGASGSGSGGSAGTEFDCGTAPTAPDPRALPKEIVDAAPELTLRATSLRLEVWTPAASPLDAVEVVGFGKSACDALLFDLESFQLPESSPELARRVRIVVVDPPTFGAATGAPGAYGVSFPQVGGRSDAVILPDDGFSNLFELDDTLAHELSHIAASRRAPYDAFIPWWLIEGTAVMHGSYFGVKLHGLPTSFVGPWVDVADGADATLTFDRYGLEDKTTNLSETGHDQALSGFFVEFLRVRVARPTSGSGFPDVESRLLAVMKRVSDGDALSSAFSTELEGVTLDAAQASYVQFLDDTVGDLPTRYAGTVFE